MTLNRLWLVVALALPALLALLVPLAAVDLAYQVRAGDEILRTGTLPGVDTYTFTVAGSPWTDQQWLAQVLLGGGHSLGGWELLTVLRAALVAVLAGLLVAVAMTRGASPRAAAILSLGAFLVAVPALALRPQLFGMVAFASLLLLAARRHGHPAQYLAAPLMVALWANLHGSFVLAPLLLGYAWLDDAVQGRSTRVSLVVMVLGAAATLVNPFGSQVWAYAAGIGTDATITGQVSEWQRTSLLTVQGLLFYASAVVALVIALRGRVALRWPDWLWLAGLLAIGAWAERGVAWWPLGMVYVLAPALAAVRETRGEPRAAAHRAMPPAARARRLNAIVAAVLVLGLLVALPWWRPSDPLTGRVGLLSYAPAGLAARLRQLTTPGTRVFAPQTWGSWFEWAVPDARYFVDARFELFPADVWTDYDAVARGADNAADVVDRWRVSIVVAPPGSTVPAGWVPRYQDTDGEILVRGGS